MVALDGSTLRDVPGLPEDAYAFSLTSDGRTIAFVAAVDRKDHVATIGTDGQGFRDVGPGRPAGDRTGCDRRSRSSRRTVGEPGHLRDARGRIGSRAGSRPTRTWMSYPEWSPNGRTIVYDNLGSAQPSQSGFSDTSVIMSIPAAGGSPTQLSKGRSQDIRAGVFLGRHEDRVPKPRRRSG